MTRWRSFLISFFLVIPWLPIFQAKIGEYCPAGYQFSSKGPNKNFQFIEDSDHYKFGYWRLPFEHLEKNFDLNATILEEKGWTLTFRLPGNSKLSESDSLVIQTTSGIHLNVAGDGLSFSLTSHPNNRNLLSMANIKSHFNKNKRFYFIYLAFYDEKNVIPFKGKKAFQKVTFHLGEYASTECMFIRTNYRMAEYDPNAETYVDIKKHEPYTFGAPEFDGPGFQSIHPHSLKKFNNMITEDQCPITECPSCPEVEECEICPEKNLPTECQECPTCSGNDDTSNDSDDSLANDDGSDSIGDAGSDESSESDESDETQENEESDQSDGSDEIEDSEETLESEGDENLDESNDGATSSNIQKSTKNCLTQEPLPSLYLEPGYVCSPATFENLDLQFGVLQGSISYKLNHTPENPYFLYFSDSQMPNPATYVTIAVGLQNYPVWQGWKMTPTTAIETEIGNYNNYLMNLQEDKLMMAFTTNGQIPANHCIQYCYPDNGGGPVDDGSSSDSDQSGSDDDDQSSEIDESVSDDGGQVENENQSQNQNENEPDQNSNDNNEDQQDQNESDNNSPTQTSNQCWNGPFKWNIIYVDWKISWGNPTAFKAELKGLADQGYNIIMLAFLLGEGEIICTGIFQKEVLFLRKEKRIYARSRKNIQ